MARRPAAARWSYRLVPPLQLADGTRLVTLGDAAALLLARCAGVRQDDMLAEAGELLLAAAASGAPAALEAATAQLRLVLKARRWL